LLILLLVIFLIWGQYALNILVEIPEWVNEPTGFEAPWVANLYWMFLIGTILWFGSAALMLLISYGLYKRKSWAWTTAMILNSLCLFVFSIMLAAFIVAVLIFQDIFSITGIVTTVLALLIDIGIVYLLTRKDVKAQY
jgi:hypothetical protein